jgi:roadblock/LC7 domain-containing protein
LFVFKHALISLYLLLNFYCSLDDETKQRQALHEQLASSTIACATSQRSLDELRHALKASEDKILLLQADLSEALRINSVLQADNVSSASKIVELESDLQNIRAAVAEKLPLADRVLQLEKDINASEMKLQDAKMAHAEVVAQAEKLQAEKMLLHESFQTFQADTEERFIQTFKTKEEYILQVQAAESELEQTKQLLLQMQFTCNDLKSRVEESKQQENRQEFAQKELKRQLTIASAAAANIFEESCTKCFATVNLKLDLYGKRITKSQENVRTGAKMLSFARALAASTQSNHEKALATLSGKLNEALIAISTFPDQLRSEQELVSHLREQVASLECDLAKNENEIKEQLSISKQERIRELWKMCCVFLTERQRASQQAFLIGQVMQDVHKYVGGVRKGHPLFDINSSFCGGSLLSCCHETQDDIYNNPLCTSSDIRFVSSSRNRLLLVAVAHASAVARHIVAAFSASACVSSSALFSSITSPGDICGSALAAESISASRLPKLAVALDDALARECEVDVKYTATRLQLEQALTQIVDCEQRSLAETQRFQDLQTQMNNESKRLSDALVQLEEAKITSAEKDVSLSELKKSNNFLSLSLEDLQLKHDDLAKKVDHVQKLLVQSGEEAQRHRDLMILGAQALTASKVDRLELGCKLQESQSEISRLEAILENERQKVVLLQVSQSHQKAKRNTLLGSVQDLTARVSELMGQLQEQHNIFERKLREERRLRSSQEIKFVEESAVMQGKMNDAVQQLDAIKSEAIHATERLAIAQGFIERSRNNQTSFHTCVDISVQTDLILPMGSSFGAVADNPLLDLSFITALPKTPQSPAAKDAIKQADSTIITSHQRMSISPIASSHDLINSNSAELHSALKALARAEETASIYRKELIEITSQSAKDAHQFRLDIMNALVLAMDLTEIRGILKGAYAISRITPKGLTGPTGVSEERARRGQALLDEIETGVVSKSHELVEWASEYEAELETKVAILIARKKLREKLNSIVSQMGAMRSTQIAGQRNDLLKALKRIEREVQAVTTGDMAIISNLSGSDFTQVHTLHRFFHSPLLLFQQHDFFL